MPVLPEEVPGAANSPGISNCSLANAPALTVMAELVPVWLPVVMSVAVTVWVPSSLRVTLKELVPLIRAALAGNTAVASLLVIATVSVTLVIRFP